MGGKELFHCRLVVSFDARERSVPEPLCQRGVLAGWFLQPPASLRSAERDFLGLPIRAYSFANRRRSESFGCQEASARTLVEALGLCAGGVPFLVEPVQNGFVIGNAPAAFRRRMMKTRSGGGSCRWHGQSGAPAIHSLMACQGGSMGSWCLFRRAAVAGAGDGGRGR